MAKMIKIPTFSDVRGDLSVIERVVNFSFKRVYFIYNTDGSQRGGHRHKITSQLLVCVQGGCDVFCQNKSKEKTFSLDSPGKGLLLDADDWHTMSNFTKNCILLVIASEVYDQDDYIYEKW